MSNNADIDLNGYTLTLNNVVRVSTEGAENSIVVKFQNGTIKSKTMANYNKPALDHNAIELYNKSSLTLDKVNLDSDLGGIFAVNYESDITLTLNESVVTAGGNYGLSTNASTKNGPLSNNIIFKITKSKVKMIETATAGDNLAICFNVGGHVEINDSDIIADRQGILLRTGETHKISNTTISATGKNNTDKEYLSGNWSGGNEVPLAALVIGNRSASYKLGTTAFLDNVTLNTPEKNSAEKTYFDMYIYQNDERYPVSVTLTGNKPSKINQEASRNGASYVIK